MIISYLGKPVFKKDEVDKTPINLIPNVQIKEFIPIQTLFKRIKEDKQLLKFTEAVRSGKRLKQEAEGYIAGGQFHYRANDPKNIKQLSGLLLFDIDKYKLDKVDDLREKGQVIPLNGQPEFLGLIERLKKWKYTYAVHTSFTEGNLSLYVKIPPIRERYVQYYTAINNELYDLFAVVSDPSSQNPAFAKRISADPNIYVNEKAKEWTKLPKPPPIALKTYHPEMSDDNFQHCLDQIKARYIDICPHYEDWVSVMLGIAEEYGMDGIEAFRLITSKHHELKLNESQVDYKYKNACQVTVGASGPKNTIKTFYYLAQKSGIDLISDTTRNIRDACLKQVLNKNNNIRQKKNEVLKELAKNNIKLPSDPKEKHRFEDKLATYLTMKPIMFGEMVTTNNKQQDVENYLSMFNPCRNALNGELLVNGVYIPEDQVYIGGKIATESFVNSLISDCNILYNSVNMDKPTKLHLSSDKVPEIHPIKSFLTRKKAEVEEVTTGHIDKILASVHVNTMDMEKSDFLKSLLRKWLLSLMSFKNYEKCVMIPVLTGGQRLNKTKFFEYLLPEELRMNHFARSTFDRSDNFNRLKADRLIILDDELKSSSKTDVKLLKDLTSENVFQHRRLYSERHITLARTPSYCGTSNEEEIICDLTGNRRLVVILVKMIDFELYSQVNKDLLFLELEKEYDEKGPECFYMDEVELEKLKYYSEDSINHDRLYYFLQSCMQPLPEGNLKGAVYSDVFTRASQTSNLKFTRKEFNLVLAALNIRVDARQSGKVLVGLDQQGHARYIATDHNSRKQIVRAEFFNELSTCNGKWLQK